MDPALEQILEGCKKGDRASQKALYDGYFNQLMGIAARYVNTGGCRRSIEQCLSPYFQVHQ